MPKLQTYHVTSHEDGWAVEAVGAQRPSAVEGRKADAVKRAKELATNQKPATVIVHKQDGTVQDEFTYGDVEAATPSETVADKGRMNDVGYALAALASDALELANEAIQLARQLPGKAQERAQQATEKAHDQAQQLRDLKARREDLEQAIRDFRDQAEERLDAKAARGRSIADNILSDERVRRILDQASNTQAQVKAAITSIRRTGEAAASAGRDQAKTARSQVKAAATSAKRTADVAVNNN
jgi:hypothetical protein